MFEDSNASKEMYDLEQDPYQLHILITIIQEESGFTTAAAADAWYVNRLQELKNCKGHHDCNDIVNISSNKNSSNEVRIYVEININWTK